MTDGQTRQQGPDVLAELVIGVEPDAVPRARRFVRSLLGHHPPELLADAELVVAELVTNARLHGKPPVEVRVAELAGGVRIEVADAGRALPVQVCQRLDAMTGRGLSLIASLAAGWGVEPSPPSGKVVWAELAPDRSSCPTKPAQPEMDSDAILAGWPDGEDDVPVRFTVRLGSVPTELLLAAKAHIDNVVRELALLRDSAAYGGVPLPGPLSTLINTVMVDFAEARGEIKRQALAAAARGEASTELELHLPITAADAGERYLAALDEADRYARGAHLLTLAAPSSHRAFRRWYVQSLVDQLRGLAQGVAPVPPVPLAVVLADEVDRLSRLETASARLEVLQNVRAALSQASSPEEMAQVAVNHAARFPGVESARAYLIYEGVARSVARYGAEDGQETEAYSQFSLDADLPGAIVARTRRPLFMRSLREINERLPQLMGYYPNERNLHVLPLVRDDSSLGVLSVSFLAGELADDAEIAFVKALSECLSEALGPVAAPARAETAARHGREPVLSRFLQATVEAARDGVLAVSPDRRVLAVNRQFCELWRIPPGSVRAGDTSPALGEAQLAQVRDPRAFEDAIRWGHQHPDQAQVLDVELVDGRVIQGYAAPIHDDRGSYLGRLWYMHDETARRAANAQRTTLLGQLADAQKVQRFLLDASEVLARASGFAETLGSLARVAVPTLGDLCLIDVLEDGNTIRRVAAVHADPDRNELAAELMAYPPRPESDHPSSLVMRDRKSLWSPDMGNEFLKATTRTPRHLEVLIELGFTSYMAVPLIAHNQVLGALTLVSAGSGRRFGPADLAIAEELAGRVALVVAKERRYDRERATSHALQSSLLPNRLPTLPGLEVAVRYLPGNRDADVGGDFWDITRLRSGEVALTVGDVAGHDVTAAATMAQVRSACRVLRAEATGPADLVQLLQRRWDQLAVDRIATAVFAAIGPAPGRLRIASAGHPAPLLLQDGKAWFPQLDVAPPLGAPPEPPATWEGQLSPGASAIFFTDGLVEDRHRSIDSGLSHLARAAEAAAGLGPEAMADYILETVPGDDRGDDVALVIVRLDS